MFEIREVLRPIDFNDVLEFCVDFRASGCRIRENNFVLQRGSN